MILGAAPLRRVDSPAAMLLVGLGALWLLLIIGAPLATVVAGSPPAEWRHSRTDPAAAAGGGMRLPGILWSRYARFRRAAARVRSGTRLSAADGYMHVDLEYPDPSYIKMRGQEIHIGVRFDQLDGIHDKGETVPAHVPEHELQRGRHERNPLR